MWPEKQSPLVGVIRRAISSRKDYWRRVGGRRPARWVVSGRHQRFAGDMNCDMNQRRARYRSGRTVRHKTSFRALANILQTREARAARRCGDGCGSWETIANLVYVRAASLFVSDWLTASRAVAISPADTFALFNPRRHSAYIGLRDYALQK